MIAGLTTDTNPTIVGGAAVQAVWSALAYQPSSAQQEYVDQLVFQGFAHAADHLPEF